MQAHHPNEDATSLAAGTGLAVLLDAAADDPAEHLPTVLPAAVPKALAIPTETNETGDTPLLSSPGQP